MAVNLPVIEVPAGGIQAAGKDVPAWGTGYGYLPVGQNKNDCKKKAEQEGGYAWDEHAQACWMIFGKVVKIGNSEHSIMEGFEIVNFNFHVSGNQPAVPGIDSLPGPSIGATTGGGSPQSGYGV